MQDVFQQFIEGLKQTTFLEYIAVFTGIASVWFSTPGYDPQAAFVRVARTTGMRSKILFLDSL